MHAGPMPPESGARRVTHLLRQVRGGKAPQRRRSIQALGAKGPAAAKAVPVLAGRLARDCKTVRREAAEALGRIGPVAAKAVVPLSEALGAQDMSSACGLRRLWAGSDRAPGLRCPP